MGKQKNYKDLKKVISSHKQNNEKVGLITGCFDIIHVDHINLFKHAKEKVDILVVGLDNDANIRRAKGEGRPICGISERLEVLSAIEFIDYVFEITDVFEFGSEKSFEIMQNIASTLKPDFLITNPNADRFWQNLYPRAEKAGIEVFLVPSS